jgi:hypothetical protein
MDQDLHEVFERALADEPLSPPVDLARVAMADGTRLRRRRRLVAVGSAGMVAVVAVAVALNLAGPAPATPGLGPAPVVAAAGPAEPGCTSLATEATDVSIFLTDDATTAQRSMIEAVLRTDPAVRTFTFQSRAAAFAKFKKLWKDSPDFAASVTPASLPESYEVTMANPKAYPVFAGRMHLFAGTAQVRGQYCTPGTGK